MPELRDYVGETTPRDFPGRGGARYRNESGRNDFELAKVSRDDLYVYFYVKTTRAITPNPPEGLRLALDLDDNLQTGWRGADLLVGADYRSNGEATATQYNPAPADDARRQIRKLVAEAKLDEPPELDGLVERQTQAYATTEQESALARYDESERDERKRSARREVEALKDVAQRWHGVENESRQLLQWRLDGDQFMFAVPLSVFPDGDKIQVVSFKWFDNLPEDASAVDFYDQGDVAPEGAFFYRVKLQ